jgi:capsular polysaccharide transport system permease protein
MKNKISFFLFVILPTVIASVYYISFASEQYYIETKYVIQEGGKVQIDLLGGLSGLTGGGSSAQNSYIAREYIWSDNLLRELDPDLGIRDHYTNVDYDWWARLNHEATFREFADYWYDIIYINHDATSGITTLGVTAFSAEKGYNIAERLLAKVENKINKLSDRSRNDSLSFAKKELGSAEQKLVKARSAVTVFREQQKELDPEKTTQIRLEIVATLESELVSAEAELANINSYLQPSSFKIRSLKNKIQALKKQIMGEKKSWVKKEGKNEKPTLNTLIGDYEELLTKKTIAERLYESALTSLESARLSAIQQQQYLEVISAPYLPSYAEKPYVFIGILSVFLGSFLLWAIGSLIISAIKDHV